MKMPSADATSAVIAASLIIEGRSRGHLHVLLAGSLLATQRGRRNEPAEARHQDHGHDDDDDLQPGDPDIEPVGAEQVVAALDDIAARLGTRALRELDVVLQQDRHADRRDERRELERSAQRPIGNPLDRPAVNRRKGHRQEQNQHDGDRHGRNAQTRTDQEADQGNEGADHEDLAVREIDHADDAVDHRVPDGDEPVDRPQGDGVDQLLREIRHAPLFLGPDLSSVWTKRL
jgi:hypothetical protein